MAQFRKSIKVIGNCNDCPCNHMVWQGDQLTRYSCNHSVVSNVYKRILEYYPETEVKYGNENTTTFGRNKGPAVAFSESDNKEIEENGFPYWCPLDRSK